MNAPDPQHKTGREFRDVLAESPARAATFLEGVHPADAAEWLQDVGEEDGWRVFSSLAAEAQAELLECAGDELRQELVQRMSAIDLAGVVEELPSDEAVDILADADDRVAEDVLQAIEPETAEELRQLAQYDPETAGGIMATEFATVSAGAHLSDAVKAIKRLGVDAEEGVGVFVLDEDGAPIGYLSDRAILAHTIHEFVTDVMVQPFTIPAAADQEEASRLFDKYSLLALAVVGAGGELIGVISAEDAAEILGEEADEDIQRLIGTKPSHQQTRLPILVRVKQRLPLMGLTVIAGLASARILGILLPTGSAGAHGGGADILRYLPLIIGLSGNVGVQSSTILVRAFATGEVDREREVSVLRAEVAVGTLIGIICGGLTALFAAWLEMGVLFDPFGAALGTAIAVAVAWTALIGCMVPMGCRRLGIDPAIVAGPFLICLSDISGSVIYILVAKALMPELG